MTETELFLGGAIVVITGALIWGGSRVVKFYKEERPREHYEKSAREICKNNSLQKSLSGCQADEGKLAEDRDLRDYKDLSDGPYERFSEDDLDELSEVLTSKQLKKIGD